MDPCTLTPESSDSQQRKQLIPEPSMCLVCENHCVAVFFPSSFIIFVYHIQKWTHIPESSVLVILSVGYISFQHDGCAMPGHGALVTICRSAWKKASQIHVLIILTTGFYFLFMPSFCGSIQDSYCLFERKAYSVTPQSSDSQQRKPPEVGGVFLL